MTGKLYIDGIDAFDEYGVFVTNEGCQSLLEYSPAKKMDFNNWPDEDGIEVDLSSFTLDSRELSIKFALIGDDLKCGQFFKLLSDKSYHTFYFAKLERAYKLRLLSEGSLELAHDLRLFTLRFANDFPLPEGYIYQPPQSNIISATGYEIDGIDFSQYGVRILKGTDAEIAKSPPIKKNLLQNLNRLNGVVYDDKMVYFQSKDVKLNCLMTASSLPEFWRNYNALIHNLSQSGERVFFVDEIGSGYPCYYKSCSVSKFSSEGKIWFQFSLTLVFTSFRPGWDDYFLASEDGDFIITELGNYLINIE